MAYENQRKAKIAVKSSTLPHDVRSNSLPSWSKRTKPACGLQHTGAAAAVRAGVHSIEDGTFISDDTLRLMKEKDIYFVPTIATVQDLIDPGGDYDDPILQIRWRAMMPRVREVTAKAWKMGIKIVTGTDTGYLPKSNRRVPDEIVELVGVGMPPMDAIKAATSVSAECLGVEKRTGSIRS